MLNDCRRGPSVAGVPVFHPNGFSIFGTQNMNGRLSPIVSNHNSLPLCKTGEHPSPRLAPIFTLPKLRSQSFLPSKS